MQNPVDLPANDPGIEVTDEAAIHLRKVLGKANRQDVVGMRVAVKKAGCSGYEYALEYVYEGMIKPFDYVFDLGDFKVVIDKEIYCKFLHGGTTIAYKREGLNEGLHFKNPNVANECGCGESFTIKGE